MTESPACERLVVVGPTPPPTHGQSVATQMLVGHLRDLDLLAGHVDTKDPRPMQTLGRLDLANVVLGLKAAAQLVWQMGRNRGVAVYVPLSQNRWAFLRDALFVLLARLARRRVYLHLHGGALDVFYGRLGPVMRFIVRSTLASAHQIWVLTPSLRRVFDGLAAPAQLRVLENAAKDGSTQIGRSASEPPARDSLRVLYVSNVRPEKGCFDLLDAMQLVAGRTAGGGSEVRLVGEVRTARIDEELRRRIDGLPANVRFEVCGPARFEQVNEHYAWADLLVFPPRGPEGQPLVLLEAMAAGLPIVASRLPGIADTVRDGVDGILVEPGDVDSLAHAIATLGADPEERKRLAENARDRYEERYTPARLRARVADLLCA